jgi:hypothetical protein
MAIAAQSGGYLTHKSAGQRNKTWFLEIIVKGKTMCISKAHNRSHNSGRRQFKGSFQYALSCLSQCKFFRDTSTFFTSGKVVISQLLVSSNRYPFTGSGNEKTM